MVRNRNIETEKTGRGGERKGIAERLIKSKPRREDIKKKKGGGGEETEKG
jgi:hypothetical protein